MVVVVVVKGINEAHTNGLDLHAWHFQKKTTKKGRQCMTLSCTPCARCAKAVDSTFNPQHSS